MAAASKRQRGSGASAEAPRQMLQLCRRTRGANPASKKQRERAGQSAARAGGRVIRTKIIQNAAEFQSVRSLWEQLARDATIFQSFCWSELAASCFARREQPHVICCESDSGVALIPAAIRRDGSTSLLGEKLFDYRDVLHAGDEAVLSQAWQRLCELNRPFKLTALRGEESHRLWRGAQPQPFAHAPCVRSFDIGALIAPGGASPISCRDKFLSMHPRLGRHTRRIAKQGVTFRQHAGSERELVRFVFDTKGKQATPSENLFQDRVRREFMVRIAAEAGSRCEVYTYETNSELVAALVAFRDDAVRYCYTIYFDPRWSGFSPGQLLLFEVAARSLAEGLDCDFMTGEYPYKNRVATARVPLFTVEAEAGALAGIFPSSALEQRPAALSEADAAAKSKKDGSRPAA
jgi:CelD/BcsL family acetyltransferase involved in cellulose biosynthesis